jgi:hypothetical protein
LEKEVTFYLQVLLAIYYLLPQVLFLWKITLPISGNDVTNRYLMFENSPQVKLCCRSIEKMVMGANKWQ